MLYLDCSTNIRFLYDSSNVEVLIENEVMAMVDNDDPLFDCLPI